MEIKGQFLYGLTHEGKTYREFRLRVPTLADVEDAIEAAQAEAGEAAGAARIERHKWAACLSVEGLPPGALTADLLGTLPAREWATLRDAEEALLSSPPGQPRRPVEAWPAAGPRGPPAARLFPERGQQPFPAGTGGLAGSAGPAPSRPAGGRERQGLRQQTHGLEKVETWRKWT